MIRQLHQKVTKNYKLRFKQFAFSAVALIGFGIPQQAQAQYNTSHYTFGTGTDGSLETDFNGCDTAINVATFNVSSVNLPIGFNFYFMGTPYSNFTLSNNGQVKLFTDNTGVFGSSAINNCVNGVICLVPMRGANRSTSVVYKTFGAAPNRKFVIQWNQFNISSTLSTASPGNMQVWMEEATGKITYVYGEIYNSGGQAAEAIFISSGASSGQSGCVTGINTASPAYSTAITTIPATTTIPAGSAGNNILVPNLGSASNTARRYFSFTPPVGISVSGLNFTNVTVSGMTLNWTDNAMDEAGYLIEYSTDNIIWTTGAVTNTNATNATVSGLNSGTNYYWRVTTLTENGPTPNPATAIQATNACGSMAGMIAIGASGLYPTISAAAAVINANGTAGSVILELQSDYNPADETFPISFATMPCLAGNNTITVRPAAGILSPIVITSSAASQDFLFDGANNIVIDGRAGGIGTSPMLTINNSSATGNCFTLQNGASNNVIQYCNITGANTSNSSGLVKFSTTNTALGNSQNTIRYCNLTANASGTLAACITSLGTAATLNMNNTIAYNNFSNFFNGANASYGINIANSGNSKWNIIGNSFYQTLPNPTSSATAGSAITAINIAIGDSSVVRGNFIGGNAPLAQGVWVSNTALTANTQRIVGIQNNGGSTALPTLIDSNIVTGFNLVNTYTTGTSGAGIFTGIYIAAGNANVGVNDGNLIGSMNSTDAIQVKAPFNSAPTSASPSYGLNAISANTSSTSTVIISNNKIGGLTASGINTNQNGKVTGIYNAAASVRITNNTIGGAAANSLRCGTAGTTSGIGEIYAIRSNATAGDVISDNRIQNISQMGNRAATSPAVGIHIAGANTASTVDSIANNTIADIFNSSADGALGIRIEAAHTFIYGNNIHDLIYANTSGNSGGIVGTNTFSTPNTSSIAYNVIQRILHNGTDTTAGNIYGMNLNSVPNINVYNNTISLDNGTGSAITSGNVTVALRTTTLTSNNTIFNNILSVNSNTTSSACLWNNAPNTAPAPTATRLNANRNIYSINKKTRNFLFVQGDITSLNLIGFYNCDTCAPLTGVVSPYSVTYDADFNNNCSAYKNYMQIPGGRENATFSEVIDFVGGSSYPDNLQPNPSGASYALNGGIAHGYITDILGNTVSSATPDIGAMEFSSGSAIEGAGSYLANNTGAVNTVVVNSTSAVRIYNADCELIAQVAPSGGTAVTGNVTAQAWIDATAGNYVRRHTQITPDNNPSTATATVTLYYTQQEFNDYNTENPTALPMPTSGADPAVANLRIQKLSGTTNDGSGIPTSYPSLIPVTITPSSVSWNTDSLFWAVTFEVSGFSGFFLNTDPNATPLPVNWISASAVLNRLQHAVINWDVAEKEVSGYYVQKSIDGSKFENIATVSSKGDGNQTYSYTEPVVLNDKAWYRIVQIGKDSKTSYSKIMALHNSAINGQISIYPNPATQVLTVETEAVATYCIYDLQGKAVMKGTLQSGKNTLDVSSLAKGFYAIKIGEFNQKIVLQ